MPTSNNNTPSKIAKPVLMNPLFTDIPIQQINTQSSISLLQIIYPLPHITAQRNPSIFPQSIAPLFQHPPRPSIIVQCSAIGSQQLRCYSGFSFYNKIMSTSKDLAAQPIDEDRIIDDGFSSEEELQQEQIIVEEVKADSPEQRIKEEVRFKIPPPQEIKDKPYSLRADIETGWQAKIDLPVPVPIIFESERFDHLIRKVIRHPKNRTRLVYLGPRYQNTYYAWYDKPFTFPYRHIKAPNDMKFTNRPFCGQHWQAEDELLFDSFFEGGNLDCVMRVGEREYDCFMRVDSNTAGHLQWFNFKVRGWKKLLKYKINICNFQKDKCLFARGMKPYIYSEKRKSKEGIGWQQDGDNLKFERRVLTAAKAYEFDMRQMFRLSFQFYTPYEEDQIQIAYCIPYTYSRLGQFLQGLTSRPDTKQFLKVSKLCTSLGGLEVPLLVIHHGLEESVEEEGIPKRCIVISGRAHPGESNGSHMIEGFIDWLCGQSKQANELRRSVVFKIVPMLNPDGVALGNYRTGLSGRDFNREYKAPDKAIFPEVFHFKKLVIQNKELFGDRLLMFLDFHGHSTKKNTFMYGPEFPIIDKFYYEARIFPKLLGNATPMFRYYSCIFKINEFKVSTARAVLLRKIGIPLSYTIETSNGAFFDYEKLKDCPYTEALWQEMGLCVGKTLHEYVDLLIMMDRNRLEKQKAKRKDKKGQSRLKKSQSPSKERASIFSAMENEKIRHLFQEIQQAEENKDKDRKSDDGLSEGSSDGEGDEDDLSPAQTNFLLQIIKGGKCRSVSRCKIRTHSRPTTRKTTEDMPYDLLQIAPPVHKDGDSHEQIFSRTKRAINIRKPVGSKQKIVSVEEKKIVNTAKIINFSFCSQSQRKDQKNRFYLPPKLNFVEIIAGKWNEERNVRRESAVNRGKVVMDLSDPHFRKTFTYNLRDRETETMEGSNPYMPVSKRGRFDQYKYRRLLVGAAQGQSQV